MSKQILSSFLLVSIFTLVACTPSDTDNAKSKEQFPGTEVADTILYPVDVINLDSTDTWADTRLKKLHREKMTDLIFKSLYSGKLKAYDYYSQEEIPVEKIKKMENSGELKRDEMAQLQFEESWYFDSEQGTMTKKVHSVLLAWPVYDNQGVFQAYKAGFVVDLNP